MIKRQGSCLLISRRILRENNRIKTYLKHMAEIGGYMLTVVILFVEKVI